MVIYVRGWGKSKRLFVVDFWDFEIYDDDVIENVY